MNQEPVKNPKTGQIVTLKEARKALEAAQSRGLDLLAAQWTKAIAQRNWSNREAA